MKSAFKSARWRVATLPLLTGTAVLTREPAKSDATARQKPKQMPDKQMQAVPGAYKELKAKPLGEAEAGMCLEWNRPRHEQPGRHE